MWPWAGLNPRYANGKIPSCTNEANLKSWRAECEVVLIETRIYRNFISAFHESGFAPILSPVLGLYATVD